MGGLASRFLLLLAVFLAWPGVVVALKPAAIASVLKGGIDRNHFPPLTAHWASVLKKAASHECTRRRAIKDWNQILTGVSHLESCCPPAAIATKPSPAPPRLSLAASPHARSCSPILEEKSHVRRQIRRIPVQLTTYSTNRAVFLENCVSPGFRSCCVLFLSIWTPRPRTCQLLQTLRGVSRRTLRYKGKWIFIKMLNRMKHGAQTLIFQPGVDRSR